MKKGFIIITLLNIYLCAYSQDIQDIKVETNVKGIQLGLFGIWGHFEKMTTTRTTLRVEAGLDNAFVAGLKNNVEYVLFPAIVVEPRWYYNLIKRSEKNKTTAMNSANYFSLFLRHHPDWFVVTNGADRRIVPDFSVMPTWGVRRSFAGQFNFETAIGFGKRFIFYSEKTEIENDFNFTLRVGYTFR